MYNLSYFAHYLLNNLILQWMWILENLLIFFADYQSKARVLSKNVSYTIDSYHNTTILSKPDVSLKRVKL